MKNNNVLQAVTFFRLVAEELTNHLGDQFDEYDSAARLTREQLAVCKFASRLVRRQAMRSGLCQSCDELRLKGKAAHDSVSLIARMLNEADGLCRKPSL